MSGVPLLRRGKKSEKRKKGMGGEKKQGEKEGKEKKKKWRGRKENE